MPQPEQSVNWETTENLFVEGDNLEVLKLLKKAYAGKVKLIYIDPPYNTGHDFVYPDNFADPLSTYLQLTGQADQDGNVLNSNPDTSGRYHSAWLSMMYPRLFLARQLLRDDGVIFVSIDDHEVHHLRMLMNEVFGEENLVGCFVRRRRLSSGMQENPISSDHEYGMCFAKSLLSVKLIGKQKIEADYPFEDSDSKFRSTDLTVGMSKELRPNQFYKITDPKTGQDFFPSDNRVWRFEPKTMANEIKKHNIIWPSDSESQQLSRPRFKTRFDPTDSENVSPISTWIASSKDELNEVDKTILRAGLNQEATKQLLELFESQVFEYSKPISFMKTITAFSSRNDDIVFDFFSGSGTTAQAVMELNREDGGNRKFVLVQLPEPTGNKQFPTIAEIGKERIRRVITKLKQETGNLTRTTPEDLGFKVFSLAESHFEQWAGVPDRDPAKYIQTMGLFNDPLKAKANPTDVVWELAIKEGYGLNAKLSVAKVGKNTIHTVTDPNKDPAQTFRVCLDETVAADIIKKLALTKTDLFICRDIALDDTLAANLALQCRLKTI